MKGVAPSGLWRIADRAETASNSGCRTGAASEPFLLFVRPISQVGKTTLMVKYVEGRFDEDYIMTLGVNFMEKTVTLRNTEVRRTRESMRPRA